MLIKLTQHTMLRLVVSNLPNRVTEGDSATISVDASFIQVEELPSAYQQTSSQILPNLDVGECYDREGLVDFPGSDVADGCACSLKGLARYEDSNNKVLVPMEWRQQGQW